MVDRLQEHPGGEHVGQVTGAPWRGQGNMVDRLRNSKERLPRHHVAVQSVYLSLGLADGYIPLVQGTETTAM